MGKQQQPGLLEEGTRQSLSTAAARNLATTTKSAPQMQGITPRWLLKFLPWVEVSGGVYRVNRRLSYAVGDGVLSFTEVGKALRVIPQDLAELPLLRGFEDVTVLEDLADRFVQREHAAGDLIVTEGQPADRVYLLARGKATKLRTGKYGDPLVLGVLADGGHFGDRAVAEAKRVWEFSVKAETPCTVLALDRKAFTKVLRESKELREHLEALKARMSKPQDKDGQAAIELAAGHHGEPELPRTFVNYEAHPREYELSVAQTILRIHTRVADLYNGPMDQTREQLRLVIEALREKEEHELLNNPDFGLLHNVDPKQRISTRGGPPTPDDMDELLCRRRKTQLFLAPPEAIAAFGRECSRRGLYPETVVVEGKPAQAWRGVPFLPCPKIPTSSAQTTSVLALRFGADHQGVIGLRPSGLPDEYEPGLSVRFMGINEKAIIEYLVSAYYSAAVLVPDALGVLENVEIGR
jgi:CRP-like cAMP-binding protein